MTALSFTHLHYHACTETFIYRRVTRFLLRLVGRLYWTAVFPICVPNLNEMTWEYSWCYWQQKREKAARIFTICRFINSQIVMSVYVYYVITWARIINRLIYLWLAENYFSAESVSHCSLPLFKWTFFTLSIICGHFALSSNWPLTKQLPRLLMLLWLTFWCFQLTCFKKWKSFKRVLNMYFDGYMAVLYYVNRW